MSRELDFFDLVVLGYELCGDYRLERPSEFEVDPKGFRDHCDPLTTPNRIGRVLDRAEGRGGVKQARAALRYVAAGSRSPKESQLAMRFGMPMSYGAYGLGLPELNKKIDVPVESRHLFGKPYYRCDLYWKEGSVAIEYDSKLGHSTAEKQEADSVRRNEIEALGVHVITITPSVLESIYQMDRIADEIASCIGKRRVVKAERYVDKRLWLHRWTFEHQWVGMDGRR